MTFIRAKEIPPRSGNWCDHEVMTVHEGQKVRQKVIRYIGRSGLHPLHSDRSAIELGLSLKPKSPILTNPAPHDARIHKMKTPARRIASVLGTYYSGMPLDAIQQQFRQDYDLDMSESNYWNWIKRFTKEAIKEAKDFKPTVGNRWVADETYMKLGKRNVYFWDIMDTDTRYLLAAQAMSKIVPFKDWNDIIRAKGIPDMDYQVTVHRRKSVKKGRPIFDAGLTPIEVTQVKGD